MNILLPEHDTARSTRVVVVSGCNINLYLQTLLNCENFDFVIGMLFVLYSFSHCILLS